MKRRAFTLVELLVAIAVLAGCDYSIPVQLEPATPQPKRSLSKILCGTWEPIERPFGSAWRVTYSDNGTFRVNRAEGREALFAGRDVDDNVALEGTWRIRAVGDTFKITHTIGEKEQEIIIYPQSENEMRGDFLGWSNHSDPVTIGRVAE